MTQSQSDKAWVAMLDGVRARANSCEEGSRSWVVWQQEIARMESAAARNEIRRAGLDPWANEAMGYLWPKER